MGNALQYTESSSYSTIHNTRISGICQVVSDEEGWKQALVVLNRALELEPSNSWAMAQAAICQYAVGRPQVALETAARALELDASIGWLQCLRSVILAELGKTR